MYVFWSGVSLILLFKVKFILMCFSCFVILFIYCLAKRHLGVMRLSVPILFIFNHIYIRTILALQMVVHLLKLLRTVTGHSLVVICLGRQFWVEINMLVLALVVELLERGLIAQIGDDHSFRSLFWSWSLGRLTMLFLRKELLILLLILWLCIVDLPQYDIIFKLKSFLLLLHLKLQVRAVISLLALIVVGT